ncbi:hypothetical protein T310_1054 [Rasamsonia emersonii CBS 393.64]|uniref:Uncharacterized protein n=1 Tax=Rasamsonia emersonii (strain ATCC 16479 / CBS 393.64 / IMI 116815) TaxID=1408163 RepID=A0A0F4Z4V6_RASE3|nr:hypothetical protein T310_1054 [Rasamsonia emersonii CBS 393.64]KKA24908.1 hypothetical protein T310_1054 [Rasamsonia emersonii CBS 393.64]
MQCTYLCHHMAGLKEDLFIILAGNCHCKTIELRRYRSIVSNLLLVHWYTGDRQVGIAYVYAPTKVPAKTVGCSHVILHSSKQAGRRWGGGEGGKSSFRAPWQSIRFMLNCRGEAGISAM